MYIYIFKKNLESNLRLPRTFWERVIGGIEIWSFAMSLVFYNYVKECMWHLGI